MKLLGLILLLLAAPAFPQVPNPPVLSVEGGTSLPPVTGHAYFDMLSRAPIHGTPHFSLPLRDYARDIEPWIYGQNVANRDDPPVYSAIEDAADWPIPGSSIGVSIADGLRVVFPALNSGRVLVSWELKLSNVNWKADIAQGSDPTLRTHKLFQLSNSIDTVDRETRLRYDNADGPDPQVAQIDFRTYSNATGPGGEWQVSEGEISEFIMNRGRWTRIWHYFDYDTNEWSIWIGDEARPPTKVMDSRRMDDIGALAAFWCQAITSQDTGTTGPATLHIYLRDFAVVRNLANVTQAQALVDAYD